MIIGPLYLYQVTIQTVWDICVLYYSAHNHVTKKNLKYVSELNSVGKFSSVRGTFYLLNAEHITSNWMMKGLYLEECRVDITHLSREICLKIPLCLPLLILDQKRVIIKSSQIHRIFQYEISQYKNIC